VPLRRPAGLVAGLALSVLVATSATTAGAPPVVADEPTPAASDLSVTGFALGDLRTSRLAADAEALDTVSVAGIGLRATGGAVSSPTPDVERVRAAAAGRGLATQLVMSNYSNRLGDFDPAALHRLLSDPARSARVAGRVADLAEDGGWDGVNVDLELVRAGDAAGLTRFVQQVSDALPASATTSVDVSASTSAAGYRQGGYDLAGLGRAADVVVLMTYDQHGPTWSGPGPVGDLRWQRKAVETAAAQVPADRLDLGVAGYGYTWPRSGTGRTVTVAQARKLAARDGVRPRWHADSGEWSARLANGTLMWWSDGRSYERRVRLAGDLGVHGVALWQLGSADRLR